MNRHPLLVFVMAGALSFPAVAMDHGDESREPHRAVKALKQMDANDDGMISFDEFRPPEGRDTPEMRMDSDGDGTLSRDEVSAAATARTEEALAHFDRMDADGNGVVTQSERRRTAFNQMDSDGDGLITKRELKEARGERRRKMQERGGRRGHHPKGGQRGAHPDRPD